MILLLFVATCFLAYSNGANDNFKGVASLFGSGTTSYRTAIGWATVTTFAGSISAIFFAQILLTRFSGKGLVPEHVVGSKYFLLAIALGAGLTIIAATITGFPISTTHALTGAMIGSGLVAAGTQVNLQQLGKAFLLPLLLSPLVAVLLAAALYLILHIVRLRVGVTKEWRAVPLDIATGAEANRQECYAGAFLGVPSQRLIDAAHFVSAGVVSFARGLNDTPKIGAMLLVIEALDIRWGLAAVAVAIAIGGLLNAKKVAETMSLKITSMNHGQGFAANLSTGVLVILASKYGLPVSTTHVSVGSLFGIGLMTQKPNVPVILGILLSWGLTLPCAALVAALTFWLACRL